MNKKTVYLYFFSGYDGLKTKISSHEFLKYYRTFNNFIGWQKVEIDLDNLEK